MRNPYRVTPRIVAENEITEIVISGRFPNTDLRCETEKLHLGYVRADGLFSDGRLPGLTCGNGFDLKRPNFEELDCFEFDKNSGEIRLKFRFCTEGTHTLRLSAGDKVLTDISIFAVKKDWLHLRPFRCDLHQHSGYSYCNRDPKIYSPEYLAILNCRAGLDFVTISDHKQRSASLKAMYFTDRCNGNFKSYPGEEVHLSDLHNIHLLNVGGDRCISDLTNSESYASELKPYYDSTPAHLDHLVRHMMANQAWLYAKIKEAGGVAVFCHPFWWPLGRRFLPECVCDYVMENDLFDCLEVFGAPDNGNGNAAVALHRNWCMKKGRFIPVVGNNDSHSDDTVGVNSTVVFAENNELSAIKAALVEGNCIAVTRDMGRFDNPNTVGTPEATAFYNFLRKEYYPLHDIIMKRESEIMLDTLETAGPDHDFCEYIKLPYPQRRDPYAKASTLEFSPDESSFNAVKKAMADLNCEFWGK